MAQITSGQIEAFDETLVKQGIIDRSDIGTYRNDIEQALRDSVSQEGLLMPQDNWTEVGNSGIVVRTAAIDGNNGQRIYKHEFDPIRIFTAYLTGRKNKQAKDELDARELKLQYDRHTPTNERYNAYLGTYVTKEYFIDNPYKCSHPRCIARFKLQDEAKKHAYRHYAVAR